MQYNDSKLKVIFGHLKYLSRQYDLLLMGVNSVLNGNRREHERQLYQHR